jgi:hypothetical protein
LRNIRGRQLPKSANVVTPETVTPSDARRGA